MLMEHRLIKLVEIDKPVKAVIYFDLLKRNGAKKLQYWAGRQKQVNDFIPSSPDALQCHCHDHLFHTNVSCEKPAKT